MTIRKSYKSYGFNCRNLIKGMFKLAVTYPLDKRWCDIKRHGYCGSLIASRICLSIRTIVDDLSD